MDILITLTPEQESALARSNDNNNASRETATTLEEFIRGEIAWKLDGHVIAWKGRDVSDFTAKLARNFDRLDAKDRADISAIVTAKEPQPEEVKDGG